MDGYCMHKDLLEPVAFFDFFGTFVLIIIMALATMGGIGGGGVVVLIIQQLLFFDLKQSIALSGFSILTCSVSRYIITFKAKHPEKNAVALDYGLASVMMPTVLMGSFIGVLFNIMLPDIAIQIILALLLFFLTTQAAIKAKQIYNKENKAAKQAAMQAAAGERPISTR
jgi:uncharacterized membrane protein YfcA